MKKTFYLLLAFTQVTFAPQEKTLQAQKKLQPSLLYSVINHKVTIPQKTISLIKECFAEHEKVGSPTNGKASLLLSDFYHIHESLKEIHLSSLINILAYIQSKLPTKTARTLCLLNVLEFYSHSKLIDNSPTNKNIVLQTFMLLCELYCDREAEAVSLGER